MDIRTSHGQRPEYGSVLRGQGTSSDQWATADLWAGERLRGISVGEPLDQALAEFHQRGRPSVTTSSAASRALLAARAAALDWLLSPRCSRGYPQRKAHRKRDLRCRIGTATAAFPSCLRGMEDMDWFGFQRSEAKTSELGRSSWDREELSIEVRSDAPPPWSYLNSPLPCAEVLLLHANRVLSGRDSDREGTVPDELTVEIDGSAGRTRPQLKRSLRRGWRRGRCRRAGLRRYGRRSTRSHQRCRRR